MFNVLSTEFLKLRRSRLLLLAFTASFLPAMVRYLQYAFGRNGDTVSWEWFLASGQEITVFVMLTAVVLVSAFIFSMEYQYNTASYIFTSDVSRADIFISKQGSLLVIIAFLFAVSACSELLFGSIALRTALPKVLLLKFMEATVWYIFAYFLLSTAVSMLTVLMKRFAVSAAVVLGYLILVFPFHLKNNLYICPFMTPTVVAAKLLDSDNYIFSSYYKGVTVNSAGAAVFLGILAVVSLTVGMLYYKKSDAIK